MEIERLGPYEIVGTLGRGGMGAVYKAVHQETREVAAVKLLSADLAGEEGFRGRFEAEIETLRKLHHPNIVRLFGFGEQEGLLFYAMELVDGNSLEEELRRRPAFRLARGDADRHRDVPRSSATPTTAASSTAISSRAICCWPPTAAVKLSDFGIAQAVRLLAVDQHGNVLGTAEYMAPEQAAGQPVDAQSRSLQPSGR